MKACAALVPGMEARRFSLWVSSGQGRHECALPTESVGCCRFVNPAPGRIDQRSKISSDDLSPEHRLLLRLRRKARC